MMASKLSIPDEHRFCIVVGAGVAGIVQSCTFLRAKVLPLEEFVIIDRVGGFGGVWWTNTYPGAACDIPSHVYQISWALNPYWGKRYAPGYEIQEYYEKIAKSYNLDKVTEFYTEIELCTWDESQMLWVVETRNLQTGVKKVWTCNLLVSAAGQFSVPKKANIEGLESFKGSEWHTVNWPKNANLKGKRVGIIGTGPSAAQLLGHIAKDVGSLKIYQRSPAYCLPRQDFVAGPVRKWLFSHFPFVMSIYKFYLTKLAEFFGRHVFVPGTWWQRKTIEMAHAHLDSQVKDEKVREKLKSHDNFGCKRPLILDDYYPVFNQENVELITDPVVGLSEHGIISTSAKGGRQEHEVDVLIWGTGYKPDEFGVGLPTKGRKGQLLKDKYQPENFSLYGLAIDDFPNFFNFLGPNSLSFEASVVEEMERQADYIVQVTKYLFEKNKGSFRYAVMPREEIVKSWTLSLREGQLKHPATGPTCQSYYKSKLGIAYFFPYNYSRYKKLIKKVDFMRDWVLLSSRPGQIEAKISDVS